MAERVIKFYDDKLRSKVGHVQLTWCDRMLAGHYDRETETEEHFTAG